jgi:predicted kinase
MCHPKLSVVCGLPGVGKTTVAGLLADTTDARLLRTDVVRKEVIQEPTYSDEETERVYAELLRRADRTLPAPVVLDGTYRRRGLRDDVVDLAERTGVTYQFYRVVCDESVVRERIRGRTDDESDADFEVHKQIRFDPLERDAIVVDNSAESIEVR